MIDLQNRQRQRRPLRPRAVRFGQQTALVRAPAQQTRPLIRNAHAPHQRPQPRVADAHQHLVANGLQEISLVGLPLVLFGMTHDQHPRWHLCLFVRDHHAQRRRQPQIAQNRSFRCVHHESAQFIRLGLLHVREKQDHLRARRGLYATCAKFRRHFRRAPRGAHHRQRARSAQICPHFVDGRIQHRPRRLLPENFLIDLGNLRKITQRLRRINSRLRGDGRRRLRDRCGGHDPRRGFRGRRSRRFRLRLGRALWPPIRHLVKIGQPRVPLLFPREHRRDSLQTFQRLVLQRVLQKNLRLYDQIFQRLQLPAFFAAGRRSRGSLRLMSVRSMTWRGGARFHQPARDPLQLHFIHSPAQQFQPLLIAIVVRIDVHEPLERLRRLFDVSRRQVHIE